MITSDMLAIGMKIRLKDDLEYNKSMFCDFIKDKMKNGTIETISQILGNIFYITNCTHSYAIDMIEIIYPENKYVMCIDNNKNRCTLTIGKIYKVYKETDCFYMIKDDKTSKKAMIFKHRFSEDLTSNTQKNQDKINIKSFDDIPIYSFVYIRKFKNPTIKLDNQSLHWYDGKIWSWTIVYYDKNLNDIKGRNFYDIIRVESSEDRRVLWERPNEIYWKEITLSELFKINDVVKIRIGTEIYHINCKKTECDQCKYRDEELCNNLDFYSIKLLTNAEKIEVEVNSND